jgi:hypothetical protein
LGKQCNKFGRKNHFAIKYISKKANAVAVEQVAAFSIISIPKDKKTKTLKVLETGHKMTFMIDAGASVNIVPLELYRRITERDKLDRGKRCWFSVPSTQICKASQTFFGSVWNRE